MTGKVISIYEATEEKNKDDGMGGGLISLGFFFDKAVADKMSQGKGVMGTPGQVLTKSALKLDSGEVFLLSRDHPVPVHNTTTEALRQLARQKLTLEEAKAVGLV